MDSQYKDSVKRNIYNVQRQHRAPYVLGYIEAVVEGGSEPEEKIEQIKAIIAALHELRKERR